MSTIPRIMVQLVHLQGPRKGEIQELTDPEIRVGRHPSCQITFPRDMVTLSRIHARIVREGNRFKLIDQSTNGTYLNGQRISEGYLKDGDVLMFSEGGPKVSFLTQVDDAVASQPPPLRPAPSQQPVEGAPAVSPVSPASPSFNPEPIRPPATGSVAESVKAPFAIQYGPTLKSFHTLPIVIGSAPACDFAIQHPAVYERHARIIYSQSRYWIEDLTGLGAILINDRPLSPHTCLEPDMQIVLGDRGPKFRFLAGGRLAQIEEAPPEDPQPPPPPRPDEPPGQAKPEKIGQKAGQLFKKFFS